MKPVTLTLPFPPMTNNLFINLPNGGRAKSARYKKWTTEAAWEARIQKAGRVSGPYQLLILANRPDARKRDLDGLVKPLSDALVQAGIVEDDSLCESLTMAWNGPGKSVVITVIPAPKAA